MENSRGQLFLVDTFFSKWANSSGYFLRVNSGGDFWLILVDKNIHERSSSWVNFCGHILGEF